MNLLDEKKYIRGIKGLGLVLRELGLPHTPVTIRKYEKKGIIAVRKSPEGIRLYSPEDVDEIIKLVAGKKALD